MVSLHWNAAEQTLDKNINRGTPMFVNLLK